MTCVPGIAQIRAAQKIVSCILKIDHSRTKIKFEMTDANLFRVCFLVLKKIFQNNRVFTPQKNTANEIAGKILKWCDLETQKNHLTSVIVIPEVLPGISSGFLHYLCIFCIKL